MEKEQVISAIHNAERFDIVKNTLNQLLELIDDLPVDALEDQARIINARNCATTAIRNLQILRENTNLCHIVT